MAANIVTVLLLLITGELSPGTSALHYARELSTAVHLWTPHGSDGFNEATAPNIIDHFREHYEVFLYGGVLI